MCLELVEEGRLLLRLALGLRLRDKGLHLRLLRTGRGETCLEVGGAKDMMDIQNWRKGFHLPSTDSLKCLMRKIFKDEVGNIGISLPP